MAGLKQLSTAKRNIMFSQKEAEILSGFSRNQLRKLDSSGLVVPARDAGIVYSWNQIIFLKIINELRKDWTFKQLECVFSPWETSGSLEAFVNTVDKQLAVVILDEKGNGIFFRIVKSNVKLGDDAENENLQKSLSLAFEGCELDEKTLKILAFIAEDSTRPKVSTISVSKKTIVIVPQIVQELIVLGKKLNIKDFAIKVGY